MGGCVLAMEATAEKPPRAAAAVPVAMVSESSSPGSRRCTWMSKSPGTASLPVRSISRASAGGVSWPKNVTTPSRTKR